MSYGLIVLDGTCRIYKNGTAHETLKCDSQTAFHKLSQ